MHDLLLAPEISNQRFNQLIRFVKSNYGINLTEAKRSLVINRLSKRVRLRGSDFTSLDKYLDYIFSTSGVKEQSLLGDLLSTNKTYFLREEAHFKFFKNYLRTVKSHKNLSIWSAACSSGDEAYTISMLLNEHFSTNPNLPKFSYNIWGSDLSSSMVSEAKKGQYEASRLAYTPPHLVKKYFNESRGKSGRLFFQAKENIKKNVFFSKFNLIKDFSTLRRSYDVIFCRNVLIYFDASTKALVINNLIDRLKPGGILILAHCEGMLCSNTSLIQIQPSVFQKPIR